MTSSPRPSPPRTEERESRVRTVSGGIGGIRPKIEHRRRTGNKDEDDCGDGWGRPSLGRKRWRGECCWINWWHCWRGSWCCRNGGGDAGVVDTAHVRVRVEGC